MNHGHLKKQGFCFSLFCSFFDMQLFYLWTLQHMLTFSVQIPFRSNEMIDTTLTNNKLSFQEVKKFYTRDTAQQAVLVNSSSLPERRLHRFSWPSVKQISTSFFPLQLKSMYYHAKFGDKRLNSSGSIFWTKPGHSQTDMVIPAYPLSLLKGV